MKHSYLNNSFILSLSLCLISQYVCAQSPWPLFCVYDVHGNVILKKKLSPTESSQIKKTQFIYNKEEISLKDDDGQLILFDKDTNYITINKKGSYTTDTIIKIKKTHLKEGITVKYFSFFWDDFFKPMKSKNISDKEDISNSSGGVSRGLMQVISPAPSFQTSMDECMFKWRKVKDAQSYSFLMIGNDGKEYYKRIIQDTQLLVKFKDSLAYGNAYTWTIAFHGSTIQTEETASGQIELIDEEKVLPTLHANITDSLNGVVHDLQLADLYQENGCIKKAYSIYKELVKKYPADKSLKKLFDDFVRDNYIVGENQKK
jgi:hypothetical protein